MGVKVIVKTQTADRDISIGGVEKFVEEWPEILRKDQREALAQDVALTPFGRDPVKLTLGSKRIETRSPETPIRQEMKLASRFLIQTGKAGDSEAIKEEMIKALEWLYRRCIRQTVGPRARRTRGSYFYMIDGRVVGKNIGVVKRLANAGSILGVTNRNRLAVMDELPPRIAAIPFPYYRKKGGIGVRGAFISYQPMWKSYLAARRKFGTLGTMDFRFRFQKPDLVGQPRVANKPPMDAPVVELSNFGQMGPNTGNQWIKRRYQTSLGKRYLSLTRKR
jgi:hypothetical protein